MLNPDEEMERYLKEFRPRAIRPLEKEAPSHRAWLRPLAAAAAIVLAAGLCLWWSRRETATVPQASSESQTRVSPASTEKRMNSLFLTKLALEDDQAFNAVLSEQSRRVLPSLQGHESTLRVFAAE
jgi:ferric-dicitrate binding protein FerR (iron transport regulator)